MNGTNDAQRRVCTLGELAQRGKPPSWTVSFLMDMDESQLDDEARWALAYWRLECYQWDDLVGQKPQGFDQMEWRPRNVWQRTFFKKRFRDYYTRTKVELIEELLGTEKLRWYSKWFSQQKTEQERDD